MNRQKFIDTNLMLGLKAPKIKKKTKPKKKRSKPALASEKRQTFEAADYGPPAEFGPPDGPAWREANAINRNYRIAQYDALNLYQALEEATMALVEVLQNARGSNAYADVEHRRIRRVLDQCRDVLDRSRGVLR